MKALWRRPKAIRKKKQKKKKNKKKLRALRAKNGPLQKLFILAIFVAFLMQVNKINVKRQAGPRLENNWGQSWMLLVH